jgi:hypothetical protein
VKGDVQQREFHRFSVPSLAYRSLTCPNLSVEGERNEKQITHVEHSADAGASIGSLLSTKYNE